MCCRRLNDHKQYVVKCVMNNEAKDELLVHKQIKQQPHSSFLVTYAILKPMAFGYSFIVMEEAKTDLECFMNAGVDSDWNHCRDKWTRQLLDGVAYLHHHSIIHRDLRTFLSTFGCIFSEIRQYIFVPVVLKIVFILF
eukprot:15262_1